MGPTAKIQGALLSAARTVGYVPCLPASASRGVAAHCVPDRMLLTLQWQRTSLLLNCACWSVPHKRRSCHGIDEEQAGGHGGRPARALGRGRFPPHQVRRGICAGGGLPPHPPPPPPPPPGP